MASPPPELLAPYRSIDLAVDREISRREFRRFIPMAWPHVESAPFSDNWHIAAMAEHLQAVTEGQIKNLLFNVPPGTSKSTTVCVLWHPWTWGPLGSPESRWVFASYDQQLSTRDAGKARALLADSWFKELWPDVRMKKDQDEKTNYANTKGGYRISTSIGGRGLGEHPNYWVIDDPHKVKEAESELERKNVIEWYKLTVGSRGAAVDVSMRMVLIMQRLNEADLTGHILAEERDEWTHVCLPMEYERKRMMVTPLGWNDPRTQEGALLDPKRFPPEAVAKEAKRLGEYGRAGQLQQRPSPAGGGEIKRAWWKYYDVTLPLPKFDKEIITADTALTDTETSALTAMQAWGRIGSDAYALHGASGHYSPVEMIAALRVIVGMYPRAVAKLVEHTASGPWLIGLLRHQIPGLIPINAPKASKLARMRLVSPLIQAGNVWVPGKRVGDGEDEWIPAFPWVAELIEECAVFPAGAYTDRGDAMSQALTYLEPALWAEQLREEAEEAKRNLPVKSAREEFKERLDAMREKITNPSTRRRTPYGRRH